MLRISLDGEGMTGFPEAQEGGFLKLRLPQADGETAVRTYTIRQQRNDALDIDLTLHAETSTCHSGPATEWALNVEVGDSIEAGGPGPAKPLPTGCGFYLLAGDVTSLPAISVNLANLPSGARGLAAIEVMAAEDRIELPRPEHMEIRWIVTPSPARAPSALVDERRTYAWCACEFSSMRALRTYLRDEIALGSEQLYISSYWKSGLTE